MSSRTRGFPLELLNSPDNERAAYFHNYTSKHPRLNEAHRALWRAIHTKIRDKIIFVFGPPGVGKTTLREGIERQLTSEANGKLTAEELKYRAAVLGLDASAPERGEFSWKDFYRSSLIKLEQPFLDEIIKNPEQRLSKRLQGILDFPLSITNHEARVALEHTIRYRKPTVFLIDDAQHIGKVTSGRRLQDQLDIIKSLIKKSETLIAMIGTYELLPLRNLSGQLSRRSMDIHFPRYRKSDEEIRAFKNTLLTFQTHLPLLIEPNLQKHWKYCYAHSIGCIGILKDWLTRSLEDALSEKANTITIDILKRNALTSDQCEKIAAEALEGEASLYQRGETSVRLLEMLGFTKVSTNGHSAFSLQENKVDENTASKPRLPRSVGRKAKRDKVG
jgi:energy-coupling factor transporter ATP-binding protein EcfA2